MARTFSLFFFFFFEGSTQRSSGQEAEIAHTLTDQEKAKNSYHAKIYCIRTCVNEYPDKFSKYLYYIMSGHSEYIFIGTSTVLLLLEYDSREKLPIHSLLGSHHIDNIDSISLGASSLALYAASWRNN